MYANNIKSEQMIVPRDYWNTKSIYSMKHGGFKAVNQRDWMLLRLGIHPVEIMLMDEDTVFYLISEFYCMDARYQYEVIKAEEFAEFDTLCLVVTVHAKDPYYKESF